MQKVLPTNKTDFVTMLHDIEYLQNAGNNALSSDLRAIKNSDYSIPGLATKAGLGIRSALGLEFNKPIPGYNAKQTNAIGDLLMTKVVTEQPYRQLFKQYGINPYEYTKG